MRKIKMTLILFLSIFVLIGMSQSSFATITLTFEGLQDEEEILGFYNGGTGSLGSSGTNYGVQFELGALALIDADNGGIGNFANEPSPNTIAFWLGTGGLVMNYAAGFDTGFSFFYTSYADATVTVYDDVNATGNVLGTLDLAANYDLNCTGDPTGDFCHWDPIGVSFVGKAKSIDFSGTANQTGYDNITFGSSTPGTVPEPATLLLLGFGLAGLATLRKNV